MNGIKNRSDRKSWWERELADAVTPKQKMNVLHRKVLADIAKLPEDRRGEACDLAVKALEALINEIELQVSEEWALV